MEIKESKVKSLTIQTVHETTLETLVTNQALGGGNLMWCGDVLISWGAWSSTDQLIHDQVEGILNWAMLEYTYEMKSYEPMLKAEKLNREVAVFNMSNNPFYQELGKYIKSKQDK